MDDILDSNSCRFYLCGFSYPLGNKERDMIGEAIGGFFLGASIVSGLMLIFALLAFMGWMNKGSH